MSIAHFTLATRDIPRTADFFRRAFGWTPLERPGNIAADAAWLQIAPGHDLHLVYVADFEPSGFEGEYGRHVAIFHPGEDFAGLRKRLVSEGAELIDPLRPTQFERFFFRDPNGYVFEVIDAAGYARHSSGV
jgi:catechol 2,3-dioxygenase-like lactoylglutathione lyase family enzyme